MNNSVEVEKIVERLVVFADVNKDEKVRFFYHLS